MYELVNESACAGVEGCHLGIAEALEVVKTELTLSELTKGVRVGDPRKLNSFMVSFGRKCKPKA